jgi:thiamine transport system substrate-binding protein
MFLKALATLSLLLCLSLISCKEKPQIVIEEGKTEVLRIYVYESFISSGLSSRVIPDFEKLYDCSVELIALPASESMLQRLLSERSRPQVDMAIGLKNTQVFRAIEGDIFQVFEPPNIANIRDRSLIVDRRNFLIPFAYSYVAFVYDTEVVRYPPRTLAALQSSDWKDKIILVDPSISLSTHALLLWILYFFGERGFETYFRSINSSILSVYTDPEDALISLLVGEAPILLSNSTFQAYLHDVEHRYQYSSFILQEGTIKDIELSGIIKGSQNWYLARKFMEYMLSTNFQKHIPDTMWMYPIVSGIDLPESFDICPVPGDDLTNFIFERRDYFHNRWIEQWRGIIR